jgi:hypothetical protein
MKPSAFALGAVLAILGAVALAGCSSEKDAARSEPAASAGSRRIVAHSLFATSTDNRIVDPELHEVTRGIKPGRWSTFSPSSERSATATAPKPIRGASPRGVTTALEIVNGSLSLSAIAGRGPFHATVWVADAGGAAAPDVAASFVHRTGLPGAAGHRVFPMTAAERVVAGGRTWTAYRATIAGDVPVGGRLIVTARTAPVVIVAPEVVGGRAPSGPPPASERTRRGRPPAVATATTTDARARGISVA